MHPKSCLTFGVHIIISVLYDLIFLSFYDIIYAVIRLYVKRRA